MYKSKRPKENVCSNDPTKRCRCKDVCKNFDYDAELSIDDIFDKL